MLLFNAIPLLGALCAVILAVAVRPSLLDYALLASMWTISGLGVSVGFHRHFTHRSFKTTRSVRWLLGVAGSMAAQGSVIAWVAIHRRHHECSDSAGDPHSPHNDSGHTLSLLRGLLHSHCRWMWSHDMPNPAYYAPDLLQDSVVRSVNRIYVLSVIAGIAIPFGVGWVIGGSLLSAFTGALWGGCVRILLGDNIIWSINSLCHLFGARRFDTHDESRNLALLCIPSFGESWHNNHHAFPTSAALGHEWWELDIGYLLVKVLERLSLVHDVRTPATTSIDTVITQDR